MDWFKESMSNTKPNNRIHLLLTTQTMRWILMIALFFAGLGAFPVGQDIAIVSSTPASDSGIESEVLDVFHFDFSDLIPADARVRTTNSSNQRIKNDRFSEGLEVYGFGFLACKIALSYSEIHIDKYLKLLFQYTIQVNAPWLDFLIAFYFWQ